MGSWAQFRERKLVQWAVGYGAAAWVLLQVLGLLADTYEWPPLVMRLAVVAAAIGFAITIVVAWFHAERGSQKVSRGEIAILAAVVVIGGFFLWWMARAPAPAPAQANIAAMEASAIPDIAKDKSIAVMPFLDLSQKRDQEYFSDGISEELLNILARVPNLRVIARTSSFSFKGKNASVATIAGALHVAALLEGSVRQAGDTVRITVQLIRASDSSELWAETYDRKLDDIFKVQDDIAATVVGKLKVTLLGAVPTVRPVDPRVYPLILQATALGDQYSNDAAKRAIELFKQAVAISPNEPRAWGGLGRIYTNQAGALFSVAEGTRLGREALLKAYALDPDDALTNSRLGYFYEDFDGDIRKAVFYFQRSLQLDPTNVGVLGNAARFLGHIGRFDEAYALRAYAAQHDPADPVDFGGMASASYFAGKWDRAIAAARNTLAMSPNFGGMHYYIAASLLLGKHDAAGALKEKSGAPVIEAAAEFALGHKAKSDAVLAAAVAKYGKDNPYMIAQILAYRGESDRAFQWLDKAVAIHDLDLSTLNVDPMFANLRKDRLWLPLLRRLGKAPEQLAALKFTVRLPR
jgi:TolB-like protein/tetratricopeptide (TPR) repeat protein